MKKVEHFTKERDLLESYYFHTNSKINKTEEEKQLCSFYEFCSFGLCMYKYINNVNAWKCIPALGSLSEELLWLYARHSETNDEIRDSQIGDLFVGEPHIQNLFPEWYNENKNKRTVVDHLLTYLKDNWDAVKCRKLHKSSIKEDPEVDLDKEIKKLFENKELLTKMFVDPNEKQH